MILTNLFSGVCCKQSISGQSSNFFECSVDDFFIALSVTKIVYCVMGRGNNDFSLTAGQFELKNLAIYVCKSLEGTGCVIRVDFCEVANEVVWRGLRYWERISRLGRHCCRFPE